MVEVLVPIGAGLLFFFVGVFLIRKYIKLRINCKEKCAGIVVDIEESYDTDDDGCTTKQYTPIYSYTVDGVEYRLRQSGGASMSFRSIGGKATVHYNAENHEEAYVRGDLISLILALASMFAGVYIIILVIADYL